MVIRPAFPNISLVNFLYEARRGILKATVVSVTAAVRAVRATGDFHQRAHPRAILADERRHLALADAQRNAPQRGSRAEALADVFKNESV